MEPKTELQKNAIATTRRKELETFQRALDVQWINSRMEDGRMGRCLALIQREAEMERQFQERTDHAAIVNARAAKETSLGIEVAQVRREETCELLRRHYLRERDPTLRDLMRKLQAGYVCRDLQLQMKNNEYRRLQEQAEEKHANDVLLNALYNNREAQQVEDEEKLRRTTEYRRELQQQLVNREQQRRCNYEDTLIEKKMLEDINRTLADEDQRELAQKREMTARLHHEMVTFQQARAAWKEKQKQMVVNEERDIERQNAAASDRSAAIVAERERKRLAKEAANDKIAAIILAEEAALRERENIIKSLQEQEYLEKNVNNDIAEREKLERCRRDTKEALTAQMQNRIKLENEQRERELEFRKEAEAKLAADLQKEKDKTLEKRRRGRQYSEELQQQMRENEERAARDRDVEHWRARNVFHCDTKWREEVSKERESLIREHAPPLLGYLQGGVVTRADLPAVAEAASTRAHLAALDVRAMGTTRRHKRFSKCNAQCLTLREY